MDLNPEVQIGVENQTKTPFEEARDNINTKINDESICSKLDGAYRGHNTVYTLGAIYRPGAAEIQKIETTLEREKAETGEIRLGTSVTFSSQLLLRSDRGYYNASRREVLSAILTKAKFTLEPYTKKNLNGLDVHGFIATRGNSMYDIHLGYEDEATAKTAIERRSTHATKRKTRAYVNDQLYNSSVGMVSLSMSEEQFDSSNIANTMNTYTQDSRDVLAALFTESGEKLTEPLQVTLK